MRWCICSSWHIAWDAAGARSTTAVGRAPLPALPQQPVATLPLPGSSTEQRPVAEAVGCLVPLIPAWSVRNQTILFAGAVPGMIHD